MLPDGLPKYTLGWDLLNWGTRNLTNPDGERMGDRWVYSDEQALFILWFYAVDETGKFLYRRGMLERCKGWGKSPLLAAICITEMMGPTTFAGWNEDGTPRGRLTPSPLVQIAAISDSQADNTMSLVREMASNGDIHRRYPLLEVYNTKITHPGNRKLEKVTSSAKGHEGNRGTFVLMDEALALDTLLPTLNGWTTMGDVKCGDQLIGSSGQPVTVLKTTDIQEDRTCYSVQFPDRTAITASAGHMWLIKRPTTNKQRKTEYVIEELSTEQMAKLKSPIFIPRTPIVAFEEKELPVPPYVLGVWLGDGSKGHACITVGRDDKEEMLAALDGECEVTVRPHMSKAGDATILGRKVTTKGAYSFGLALPGTKYNKSGQSLKAKLKDIGVLNSKHIPLEYLRSSVAQRTALLQGLMDTDGSASKTAAVFVNTNKWIADGVADLARSLGHRTTCAEHANEFGPVYWVYIQVSRDLFRFKRKQDKMKIGVNPPQWQRVRVTLAPSVPVKCVAVDSDDHLFLAGISYKVTRNTHLWVNANQGPLLYEALTRNLVKKDYRWIETTNAPEPGQNSVAELSHAAYDTLVKRGKANGILMDSRSAYIDDIYDEVAAKQALVDVYGDAVKKFDDKGNLISGWVNIERIWEEINDPQTREQVARRFYFNQITSGISSWLNFTEWQACKQDFLMLEVTDPIALGFRGQLRKGAAVLVACRLTDGALFNLSGDDWETPENADDTWEVPQTGVDKRVREVLDTYNVKRLLCDPTNFQIMVGEWYADHEGVVEEYWTSSNTKMARAVEQFETAVKTGRIRWNDKQINQHVLNAHTKETTQGIVIRKDVKLSKRYITGAQAAILALEASVIAIMDGALNEADNELWTF